MIRKSFVFAISSALSLTIFTSTIAKASDYPRRSINVVVPYKAGGGTDAYARALAAAAKGTINAPLVVVNKPGAGGLNGAQSTLGARPDGYTIMLTSGGSFLLSTLTRNTKIDALKSFEFVGQIGQLKTSLIVSNDSPYKTAQDLINAAKDSPSTLRWAHSGRGGFHYIAGLGFLAANGIEAQDVPFKGGGPARAAIMSNQTDFGFIGIQQLKGFEEQLRGLAVNASTRDQKVNSVPSFKELNIPYSNISSPVIILAPKNTPKDVITYLESSLKTITKKPIFVEMLSKRGTAPAYLPAEDTQNVLMEMKSDILPILENLKK
ncbi:Bug family tripartite tricarboxylate transporter substrate binding protein [Marinomonas pollencensis]|uniref:Tripartite-type tricarboxylate transporter receptor subunit TctC n=1 Tax=Marinomonas pollencensis TaxID=491954 RepID=A0A3E0DHE0_9GAMM|nr:tripartite tricarboxylate transporter substrate binding protein [Marinomonas pollencensis]REG82134.1 tripartite-type tricarboxylate transporter receptor subunit TctC [Marinomonas pollencensis]